MNYNNELLVQEDIDERYGKNVTYVKGSQIGRDSQETINETVVFDPRDANNDADKEIETNVESEHLKTFLKIESLNFIFGTVVGFAVNESWKYNNATRWTKFMLISSSLITIYSHVVVLSEPSKSIEVFSIFGVIIPACLKFNVFTKSWRSVLSSFAFLEKICSLNPNGPKGHLMKQHIDETLANVKIFISIQTMALIIFVCYPIYAFIAHRDLIPIMPMLFPYLDQNTTFGFVVANLIMLKMGLWGYCGSVAFDLYLARSIYNYSALPKLLQLDLLDYADMWKKGDEYSDKYKKEFLRNILMKCQDKDRYIHFISGLFADFILKQFCALYVCLILTIYGIIRSKWYSGFGFLIFCFTQVYILCILGTKIKTENENLCLAIYNMPWYEYPIPTQKIFLMLLQTSDNAMELWIGSIIPLNMESAMDITKSIYSTSTMIAKTGD